MNLKVVEALSKSYSSLMSREQKLSDQTDRAMGTSKRLCNPGIAEETGMVNSQTSQMHTTNLNNFTTMSVEKSRWIWHYCQSGDCQEQFLVRVSGHFKEY
jgi:hypothetical protein